MKRILRYFLLLTALWLSCNMVLAQATPQIRGMHKVKKKETIFGIARQYEIGIDDLINCNPEMKIPGYELKKGDIIRIPYPSYRSQEVQTTIQATKSTQTGKRENGDDLKKRAIRVGVMLPLHNINGDGKRMVEYYRGILMACDSLKKLGISVDVHAWNAAEDCDIANILKDKAASQLDIIFGPLYSRQMQALSDFVTAHDIRLVIPFSIHAPQLLTNRNIFQVWQSPNLVSETSIARYLDCFKDCHHVFIDCNDSTSKKGAFTFGLRRQLETRNIDYSITNLTSSEAYFTKAFSQSKRNVVILNTGRSAELGVAFAKLNGLKLNRPELDITMFGYTEWLSYTRNYLDNFYKFNTYIPAAFHYNPLSRQTEILTNKYRMNFHTDMINFLPRLALTGFDHAFFFIRGLHKYGKDFNGAAGLFGYPPVQTPLVFERVGNGGLQNNSLLFIHYAPDQRIETVKF